MADEIRKVLQLSLGESPQNVKELKKDINELKNAIGDMVIAGETGTTKYDQAVKLLGNDLKTLAQVQNATKKEVDALEGSYDSLVQKMRLLKTEWRATNDVARRDELGKQIVKINNELKTLDYGLGNYGRNVGNYGNAWESLAGTLNVAQSSGSQFVSGLNAMSGILGLTATESDNLNSSLNVMRGVVGALNGAKGIAGLVKSIASQRAATKAAKAETQKDTAALNAQKVATDKVTTSTTLATVATNLFKKALYAIGIGIIVALIGELIANLDKVTEWFGKLGEKLGLVDKESRDLKKSNELLKESIEKQNDVLEDEVELMQAKGIAQSEILQKQKTVIAAELAEAKATNAKVKARLDELEALGKRKREQKKLLEQYEENEKVISELEHKLAVLEAKIDTDAAETAKKAADERAKAAKDAADKRAKAAADAAKQEAEILKRANDTIAKIDTAREAEIKRHTGVMEQLEKDLSTTTVETTKKAIEAAMVAEKELHTKNLTKIIVDEYKDMSEKAAAQLENELSSRGIGRRITDALVSTFSVGDFFKERNMLDRSMQDLNAYYANLESEAVKVLASFKDDMTPAAKEALGVLAGYDNGSIMFGVRDLYEEFLTDSEAFLKEYGEPFTTAINEMGQGFEGFAESYSEGFINTFEFYRDRLDELIGEGRLGEAQVLFDKMWVKFGEMAGDVSPEAEQAIKDSMLRLEGVFDEALIGAWDDRSDAELGSLVRGAYQPVLDEIETNIEALREMISETTGDTESMLSELANLEEDYRRITMKRDAEMLEARTRAVRTYANSLSNLLGNVASAWENIIRAQVEKGEIEEEQARESFERMKWLQYAVAGINTAAAVVQALADPAVPTYYLRAINAAAALATGIAQIAQIASTSYGSRSSGSSSTPRLVDRSPVVSTVSLNASEAGESMQQNMRVYVLESDITDAQNATKARVEESTF